MIRRDVAPPPAWILISQIDHARLAARLAEHWGAGEFPALWPAAELLWAIEHHDDGWRDWDLAPGVDPDSGQPRSFTEMIPADSLAIWTASIETARHAGPLETYVVAGHFCVLARRGSGWLDEQTRRDLVGPFLAKNDRLMVDCLSQWRARRFTAKHAGGRGAGFGAIAVFRRPQPLVLLFGLERDPKRSRPLPGRC